LPIRSIPVVRRSIGFCSSGFWLSRRGSGTTSYFKFREKFNAELALGFDYRTYYRLHDRREISGAGSEGIFRCGDVMDEKPITDKENFPPEDSVKASMVLPSIAYSDGCADGYRKAMIDIMVFSLLGILCLKLAQSLSR
jgi:hypothetical protein